MRRGRLGTCGHGEVRRVVSWSSVSFKMPRVRTASRRRPSRCPRGITRTRTLFERERERFYRARCGSASAASRTCPRRGDYVTREVAGDSVIVVRTDGDRRSRVLQRVPASRHAALRRRRPARSAARFSVRTTRGRTTTRAGSSARRTWTDRRDSGARTSRSAPCARTSGTDSCSCGCRPTGPSLAEHLAPLPAKFAAWRMGELDLRASHRLRRRSQLEAHRPELQRVPALSDAAPGAEQALALPQRRERAAAADVHGRPDGSQ